MNPIGVFILRASASVLGAMVLSWIYYGGLSLPRVAVLAFFMCGASYLLEAYRRRSR